MTLNAKIFMSLEAAASSAGSLTTLGAPVDLAQQVVLASGTGAGKADKIYVAQRTLAASASEDLDLSGVLADPFGATLTFARIKAIWVRAAAGNSNNVVVGAASGSPWTGLLTATGTLTVRPGTTISVAAGVADATAYVVTASTADLLKVANSGAGSSITYDIAILGTSA